MGVAVGCSGGDGDPSCRCPPPLFFPPQEFVLSHTELPSSLQGAQAAIKKHEDFMATMEAGSDRLQALVAAGHKLVAEGGPHAAKIRETVEEVERRCVWGGGGTEEEPPVGGGSPETIPEGVRGPPGPPPQGLRGPTGKRGPP